MSSKIKVPRVITEAQKVASHLDKDLMDRIVETPWFFGGTTFEVLSSGVVKVVYFHQRSDIDHWYRGRLLWRDEDSRKWQVDKMGQYSSLVKARKAIDEALGAEEEAA